MSVIKSNIAKIEIDETVGVASRVADGHTLCGIVTPSVLTGTTLSFMVSIDGVSYYSLVGVDGVAVSLTVGVDKFVRLNPSDFAGIEYLKLVSGSAEAADREFVLVYRSIA